VKIYVYLGYISEFVFEWEKFRKKVAEKIKTQFISKKSFLKSRRIWDNVRKYGTARQATRMTIQGDQKLSVHLMITVQQHAKIF
jgi:hypothetical protein